jgi:thiol:disulfide interchange protein
MPPHREAQGGSSRPLPRILLLVAAALLVARVGTGIWEARSPREHTQRIEHGEQVEHGEFVKWQPIATAEAAARVQHKPIFYDFSAAWCGPCKMMSAEVFADPNRAKQINSQFVPVQVVDRSHEDGRNAPEVQALQDRFEIDAFPTIVLYSPETGRHESLAGYGGGEDMFVQLSRATVQVNRPAASQSDSLK